MRLIVCFIIDTKSLSYHALCLVKYYLPIIYCLQGHPSINALLVVNHRTECIKKMHLGLDYRPLPTS